MSKTPMMRQYDEAKKACGDALLLFRMGDFYELFHEDAKKAAKILGLTLTSRDKSANAIPMAGFPHHQLDAYLAKLIKRGLRVAICEQVENPREAKGLVKREVTQVVSPGTVTDQQLLDPAANNYLVAVFPPSAQADGRKPTPVGVAWADLSTGRFCVTATAQHQLPDLLARLDASEVLIPQGYSDLLSQTVGIDGMITERPAWCFGFSTAEEILKKQFEVASLDGYGIQEFGSTAVSAAGALIEYLNETQKSTLGHFNSIIAYRQNEFVEIDSATWRSLEISTTIRSGDREGSLLGIIDRSSTPMGSRLLGDWLANPLTQIDEINLRLDAVGELVEKADFRKELRGCFENIYDLQRLIARVATGRASPRDLGFVAVTLGEIPRLKKALADRAAHLFQQLELDLDLCTEIRQQLQNALGDSLPTSTKEGGFIKSGFNDRLDELRQLACGGKQWIAKYQQTICKQTAIPSLKVGYNKVFGYYLEVTHTHRDKIPEGFIRKQTLKNAERYITPELKEYEEKVVSAESEAQELELQLFDQLRELVRAQISRLKSNAEIIAELDAVAGLSQLAVEQGYRRPEIVEDNTLEIHDGRHPVLDVIEPLGAFVPNSTSLDQENGILHLITGPNMAGKSTYIRQVALITLMAQTGSFVPAASARIGLVDKIFARVGASDELTRGQSTFMVEMTETARILNTASPRSLVILDEIGRGTSTYDGVSLAWAIVEYLHDQIGCRTLFATHYHELTELATDFAGVKNYNVAVKEWAEKIVFLHKIVCGSADKSYGIHVAKLAGVPGWVNQRAEQILSKLESSTEMADNRENLRIRPQQRDASGQIQLTLFGTATHPLIDKIKALDANHLTPMNALEMLHQWKDDLAEETIETTPTEIEQTAESTASR
jgi:DNA mismatch repair protein MutS